MTGSPKIMRIDGGDLPADLAAAVPIDGLLNECLKLADVKLQIQSDTLS